MDVAPMITVAGGFHDEKGTFKLTTVRVGQANIARYLWAQVNPNQELRKKESVMLPDESEEEYQFRQRYYMNNSQQTSAIAAFRAASMEVSFQNEGALVASIIKGMPAEGKLQVGDLIVGLNGTPIETSESLVQLMQQKAVGETLRLQLLREDKPIDVQLTVGKIENEGEKRPGIGVSLLTKRNVKLPKEVQFETGNIGGPSAGLMFSLEILNQLTEEDLTKGYVIAGTGMIDENGNVGRIGGIEHKVVAADEAGAEFFFAPRDAYSSDPNATVAKQRAEEIGSSMQVIPVDTLQEALQYLRTLPRKNTTTTP